MMKRMQHTFSVILALYTARNNNTLAYKIKYNYLIIEDIKHLKESKRTFTR